MCNIKQDDYFISNELDESNKSYIYGEVCSKYFINILNNYSNENRNFFDIGSGCDRLIIFFIIFIKNNIEI
jgi:hypothetical protein